MRKKIGLVATFLLSINIFGVTLKDIQYKQKMKSYSYQIDIPKMIDGEKKYRDIFNNKMLEIKKGKVGAIDKDIKAIGDYINDATFRPYDYKTDFKVYNTNMGLQSIVFTNYKYTGGAHGSTELSVYTINEKTGEFVDILKFFQQPERKVLIEKIKREMLKDKDKFSDESIKNLTLNGTTIYFDKDEVVVVYGLYQIAPYSVGMPTFRFKANEILN